MKDDLEAAIVAVCTEVYGVEVDVELTRPDERLGDYATNLALQLAGKVGKQPREVADTIVSRLQSSLGSKVQEITVAGPGFINFSLSDDALWQSASEKPATPLSGKQVVAEYSDPSAFKVLHAGHLYTSVVGDAIANLLQTAGGTVHRVNFGGDVGLHVAKTLWAILRDLGGEHPEKLDSIQISTRSDWMSARYVEGNSAYEDDEQAKSEIVDLNKRIYRLVNEHDHDTPLALIYWTCRQWSYDYFDAFYERIGSHFEKYYPESETMELGLKTVKEQLANGVYQESDGAVIFNGEKYGLHTRVFINSQGLPTYEAKDVGLIMMKWDDYHFDKSIILTDSAQGDYMTVVLKSVEQFAPQLSNATTHITHGRVKLAGGVKMSSRKGNIIRAVDVLDAAAEANKAATGRDNNQAVLGAVKYAFLKQRIGADIIYDPKESVSLDGNSGPYLQYAHARARSILVKANAESAQENGLESGERSLLRKISEYSEVIDKAISELMPHHVCTYLYELAQTFNRFYEHNRVIGDERQHVRLRLVECYANVLKDGLSLLGVTAPDKM